MRFLILALLLLAAAPAVAAAPPKTQLPPSRVGIAVVVNDDIITFSDIDRRIALYAAGRGTPPPEVLAQMREQVAAKLIDERLQMQEAKTLDITVAPDQIEQAFANLAKQNNLPPEEFRRRLTSSGAPIETLYDQLRAEVAWGQVVRRKLRPRISISESEIDSEIELIAAQPQTVQAPAAVPAPAAPGAPATVHLKQILIPVNVDDPEAVVQAKTARAIGLQKEIASCADMDAKMKDFLTEGTGDLGHLPVADLPAVLRNATDALAVGQVTQPIRTDRGIAVLAVCGRTGDAAAAPVAQNAPPAPAVVPDKDSNTDRQMVANKIGLVRLNQMADRYLRDLRAAAFIDRRL